MGEQCSRIGRAVRSSADRLGKLITEKHCKYIIHRHKLFDKLGQSNFSGVAEAIPGGLQRGKWENRKMNTDGAQ